MFWAFMIWFVRSIALVCMWSNCFVVNFSFLSLWSFCCCWWWSCGCGICCGGSWDQGGCFLCFVVLGGEPSHGLLGRFCYALANLRQSWEFSLCVDLGFGWSTSVLFLLLHISDLRKKELLSSSSSVLGRRLWTGEIEGVWKAVQNRKQILVDWTSVILRL